MNFERFNNSSPFATLNLDLTKIEETMTAEQLLEAGKVVKVLAIMFSNKGEYGKSAFLVCEDSGKKFTMWLPKNMVETCEAIVSDKEAVEGILDGKCGVKGRKYLDKKGVDRFTIEWCNM